jgi:multiple sugar transport system permease protein
MFFSPISEKSLKVRSFYAACYVLLGLGAVTILTPLLIMLTGSASPTTSRTVNLLPDYLVSETAFWRSYLAVKYNQSSALLRQAWGDPSADFLKAQPLRSRDLKNVELWSRFSEQVPAGDVMETSGFFGTSRLPQYNARRFRNWLLGQYGGDLAALNAALGTEFASPGVIMPPALSVNGARFARGPLGEKFLEFVQKIGSSERVVMNCGGYYRAVFLPQLVGHNIAAFNQKFGAAYSSYAEVPFSATVPAEAPDLWFLFVSRIVRPDFIVFTEVGQERFLRSGLSRDEFIRRHSRPEDLRVQSRDVQFTEWAAARGAPGIGVPQRDLDWSSFQAQKFHWRSVFLTQNYRVVMDEIFVHGRALGNTLFLVVLSVAGTLIVNPMAAYALSRYKPRRTYQILLFCLLTLALPAEVTMIPIFLQLKEWGLLNTFGALILPGLANGFSIFLLKGFFDSLPRELYEAAELDGASELTIFWQLTMNLSRPILAVLALGAFTTAYGTFMYALILCPDPRMWTIMVYLFQMMQKMNFPILYAALLLASVPTIFIFIFCQNIILRGLVIPSEK